MLVCGIFEIEFENFEEFKKAVEKARMDERIKKTCEEWVKEWSFIPTGLLEKAYGTSFDDIEIIAPTLDDYRRNYKKEYCDGECEYCFDRSCEERYLEENPKIPMWSWVFTPKEEIDQRWLKDCAKIIADWCDVIVYYTDEIGYYVGINGAGYDFYDIHWIPMYVLRGLKWHERL